MVNLQITKSPIRLQYKMQPAFEAAPAPPVLFTARLLLVGDTTFPVLSFPVGYGPFKAGDWATLAGCQPGLRFTNLQRWLANGVFREFGEPLPVPVAMLKALHPCFSNVRGDVCYAFKPAALSAALVRMEQFKACPQLPFASPTFFPVLSELPMPRVQGVQVHHVHCLWGCVSFCMLLQCCAHHTNLNCLSSPPNIHTGCGYCGARDRPWCLALPSCRIEHESRDSSTPCSFCPFDA